MIPDSHCSRNETTQYRPKISRLLDRSRTKTIHLEGETIALVILATQNPPSPISTGIADKYVTTLSSHTASKYFVPKSEGAGRSSKTESNRNEHQQQRYVEISSTLGALTPPHSTL